jgi:GNAT superfamily N-acetyltransferase
MLRDRDLVDGVRIPDSAGMGILYRYLSPSDDLEEITQLLHESYAPLAAAGMRFVASFQDSDTRRSRASAGETIVALLEDQIIGVITLADVAATRGTPFYDRADVASFGQFAVRPSYQRRGVGSTLIKLVEERARHKGIAYLALDTSEHATTLIAMYRSRGYQFVEHCQWDSVNYRSMVFAKRLENTS